MSVILIGGTPGTGKTKVAKELGKLIGREIISLGEFAIENGCVKNTDTDRDTKVIDEDCLVDKIIDLLDTKTDPLIIEGHYIDIVPSKCVERACILRTHPDELKERLHSRNYSDEKISENIEAEIIGVCQMDALESFGADNVYELDTSSLSASESAQRIVELMKTSDSSTRIDWMMLLENEGRLGEFLIE